MKYPKLRIPKSKKEVKGKTPKKEKVKYGFSTYSNEIWWTQDLSLAEKGVLSFLLTYFNSQKNCAWVSGNRIDKELKIWRATRGKIINSLIKKKWIKRIERKGLTNHWVFNPRCFPAAKKQKLTFSKGRPFYRGDPMQKRSGKWFVMENGAEWKEYSGKESEIEWK